jgi:cephalosporin-C deacetylase-like acetyl esterase
MNRRKFLVGSGACLLAPAFLPRIWLAQAKYNLWIDHSYAKEMPDMLISYLSGELNALASDWNKKRAAIKTAAELQSRIHEIQAMVLKMLGDFPEKNPLDAVTVKTIHKDGFRIENVMFQSRPDFWVTGNLYVPTTGDGPFPGIISPCGHYNLARMVPQYQAAYHSLVKSGFVVMAFDPIGEGERRYYWNPKTDSSPFRFPTYEHSMPGQLQLLLGENMTNYRIWDAKRAIDYLLTRPEVDHKKIGCVGHSGGGSMTDIVSAVDERIRCVVSLEGGMSNRWPVHFARWQPIGPSDVEQNLFPGAAYGVDEVDLHTAMAPRPVLTAKENYDPRFDKAANEVQERYRQLGALDKFATVSADDPHSWSPKLRVAATDWFCRWFYGRKGPQTEELFETLPPEELRCTPDGSLRYSGKGKTIFDFIREKQANLPPAHPLPKTRSDVTKFQEGIRGEIRKHLDIKQLRHSLDVRHLVTTPREGYRIEKIQFISEPGIYVPVWVFVPNASNRKPGKLPTVLYVSDEPMSVDGMEFAGEEASGLTHGVLDTLAREGNLVAAVSVRGIAETRPPHPAADSCNEFSQLFNLETAMAYMTWFMDRSLLGMRVQDVMRSVDYISSRDDADTDHLHAIGTGMGATWCLYAAALDPRIQGLIAVDGLLSYRTLTESDRYLYGADVFVRNVLLHFDLPQVAAAVADRQLALIQPRDAMKKPVSQSAAEEAYQTARSVYRAAGQEDRFRIETGGENGATPQNYLRLLRGFQTS